MQLDINLIPWREQRRQQRIRHFVFSLGLVVMISALVVVIAEHYLQSQIRIQQSRVDQLSKWNSNLSQKVSQVNAIENQVVAIERELVELQALYVQRYVPQQLVALLPELIPEAVYLDQIEMVGRQVRLIGIAATAEQLNALLANLQGSPLATEIRVQSVVHGVQRFTRVYQTFSLTFKLVEGHLG